MEEEEEDVMRQLEEEAVEAELLATEAEQGEPASELEAAVGILEETAATPQETFAVAAWRTAVVARLAVVGTVGASERLAVVVVARAALACPDLEEDPS